MAYPVRPATNSPEQNKIKQTPVKMGARLKKSLLNYPACILPYF